MHYNIRVVSEYIKMKIGGTKEMKKNGGIFVKINYKMDLEFKNEVSKDKINCLNNMDAKRYLFCAGVYNKNGGTMIFKAKDLDEAKDIIYNNPFSKTKMYNYEILSTDNIAL